MKIIEMLGKRVLFTIGCHSLRGEVLDIQSNGGWLFKVEQPVEPNGYAKTGTFYQTGDVVFVEPGMVRLLRKDE